MSSAIIEIPSVVRGVEAGVLAPARTIDTELTKGDILIEAGQAPLSGLLLLRSESPLTGWDVIGNVRSTLDRTVQDAGWVLFFMAGEIKATGLAFNDTNALRTALTRLAGIVKAQACNAFEITDVSHRRLAGISRVNISGHVRHLQKGSVCFGQ